MKTKTIGTIIGTILVLICAFMVFYYLNNRTDSNEAKYQIIEIDPLKVVEGAREYISLKPEYSSELFEGGYPTENVGACTDVIWYALKNAGFIIKDEIDKDIKENYKDYNITDPNPDIDFRRVKNLYVFFDKYATRLSTNLSNSETWQPGDIIIFEDYSHIAICSDKRNEDGLPYIIHHSATKGPIEADDIKNQKIMAHFRLKEYKIEMK